MITMELSDSHTGAKGQVSVTARNPWLDALRQSRPDSVAAARRGGPAPTLFSGGDLPPFTASGLDPNKLLTLPWCLRHPVAQSADMAWIHQIYQENVPPTQETAQWAWLKYASEPANAQYLERFRQWVVGRP